jgi:hypothetical protein
MNKSILIIDTPKSCTDCRLKRGLYCGENGNSLYEYIHYDESLNDKPSWCPLKPLPQKKEITESMVLNQHYQDLVNYHGGWNNCIDEILGGNDD